MKYLLITSLLVLPLSAPIDALAAKLEVSNITVKTSDGNVITSGDSTGKMVPIYGGEEGRVVLNKLIARSSNPELSDRQQLIAELLEIILLNRWQELVDN